MMNGCSRVVTRKAILATQHVPCHIITVQRQPVHLLPTKISLDSLILLPDAASVSQSQHDM